MIPVDEALHEIRAMRRTTRAIVGDEALTVSEKCLALLELGERARLAKLPRFAASAVWAEARTFLGDPDPDPWPRPADGLERACRRLRASGLVRCPTCEQELPGNLDLERWSAIRALEVEKTRARERAVGELHA
jgi:hypothetical protein